MSDTPWTFKPYIPGQSTVVHDKAIRGSNVMVYRCYVSLVKYPCKSSTGRLYIDTRDQISKESNSYKYIYISGRILLYISYVYRYSKDHYYNNRNKMRPLLLISTLYIDPISFFTLHNIWNCLYCFEQSQIKILFNITTIGLNIRRFIVMFCIIKILAEQTISSRLTIF